VAPVPGRTKEIADSRDEQTAFQTVPPAHLESTRFTAPRAAAWYLNGRFLLWGVLLGLAGGGLMFVATLWQMLSRALPEMVLRLQWAGAALLLLAIVAMALELFFILPIRRQYARLTEGDGYEASGVTVALTAFNDEESIGPAVEDFLAQHCVKRVIVVNNNSQDRTEEVARAAGAIVINEMNPGYGACVYRGLSEAVQYEDTECVALCEGDLTFRARDLTKLLAFLPNAEIVNGTRIVEQLRAYDTQLTTFMYYGNFFVGKLLEAKHIGKGTFTDVGTTYKICRRDSLRRLLPALNPKINLEFNAHFLDTALSCKFRLLECPITFHARVGKSKGGNVNNLRALRVGLAMMRGLMFGWRGSA
jgi:hypothetical protein